MSVTSFLINVIFIYKDEICDTWEIFGMSPSVLWPSFSLTGDYMLHISVMVARGNELPPDTDNKTTRLHVL
jgi:hypothetical protein